MTVLALATADASAPRKRGPRTPEGKARSSMNAVKHGLRARSFALLPEEDPAEWAGHLADLSRDLGPVDPTEEKLVTALAVATWKEIRADRAEADVLARMACDGDRGRDLGEKRNALALATAIRYASAAAMATQRAHRAFLAHRKAKQAGLILPAKEPVAVPAGRNDTNDLAAGRAGARPATVVPDGAAAKRTDVLPRIDTAATVEGEERTNDLLGPGATGPAPLNRHQRRRLEAMVRRVRVA